MVARVDAVLAEVEAEELVNAVDTHLKARDEFYHVADDDSRHKAEEGDHDAAVSLHLRDLLIILIVVLYFLIFTRCLFYQMQ